MYTAKISHAGWRGLDLLVEVHFYRDSSNNYVSAQTIHAAGLSPAELAAEITKRRDDLERNDPVYQFAVDAMTSGKNVESIRPADETIKPADDSPVTETPPEEAPAETAPAEHEASEPSGASDVAKQ